MKAFQCDHCGNLLFFENVACLGCNHTLGFLPEVIDLCALEPAREKLWKALAPSAGSHLWRQCRNATDYQICNWMVAEEDDNPLCRSCRLNLLVPDLTIQGNLERWQKLEVAKRRVMYSLLRLSLPTEEENGRSPLRFQFLADAPGAPAVITGHAQGIITVNIAEADDAERERRRVDLHEPFRTLLGHFRHEIAHYYWDRLVAGGPHLQRFRELFGDERKDYSGSLKLHYQNGPPQDWQNSFVTAYASSHAWEDWAETWAHYLHIIDTLETAASFGLSLRPRHPQAASMRAEPKKVADDFSDFEEILHHWIPLTHALNELNRGMGLHDLYPFVLSEPSFGKLRFIHTLLRMEH
ncbi:MAG: hypothetical protein JWM99_3514 [Verrucomicrobiales bacterium]|nr:hypothetical protein [Verrucomicrobiales bacterium]